MNILNNSAHTTVKSDLAEIAYISKLGNRERGKELAK